jgi:hypothetical protein
MGSRGEFNAAELLLRHCGEHNTIHSYHLCTWRFLEVNITYLHMGKNNFNGISEQMGNRIYISSDNMTGKGQQIKLLHA